MAIAGSLDGDTRPATFQHPDQLVAETVDIVLCRLDAPPAAVLAARALLSPGERQAVQRLAFEDDRRRYTLTRGRLRQLLGRQLGVAPESLELICGKHGKPALDRRFASHDLHFNVAHCGDLAAIALMVGRRVGIDIEALDAIPSGDQIVSELFSPAEQAAYRELPPEARLTVFIHAWTGKEAYSKGLGTGFCLPLKDFEVALDPLPAASPRRIGGAPGNAGGWTLYRFQPGPGMAGAVVVENSPDGASLDLCLRISRDAPQ